MRIDKIQMINEKSDDRLAQIKLSREKSIDRKMKGAHEKLEEFQLESRQVLDYKENVDSKQRSLNELRAKVLEQADLNQQIKMKKFEEMMVLIEQHHTKLVLGHDRLSEK